MKEIGIQYGWLHILSVLVPQSKHGQDHEHDKSSDHANTNLQHDKKEHGIISSTEHFFFAAIPYLVKEESNRDGNDSPTAPFCGYLKPNLHESEESSTGFTRD